MQLKSISLENWKNFRLLKCDLNNRLFVVGANASGKSNFLDALRFMRDIVKHSNYPQRNNVKERTDLYRPPGF